MRCAILLALGLAAPLFAAGELGDPAPALTIGQWIKGEPVSVTDSGQVTVVEFWATWCPPCRDSIPHLTELQKRYADQGVRFIGISDEDAATVKPFVAKMGAGMDYRVAVDANRATYKAYMGAFGINGIPHCFIVDRTGRIAWHDHPMAGIEEVLDAVVAGTFDVEAARALMHKREQSAELRAKLEERREEYFDFASRKTLDPKLAELGRTLVEDGGEDSEFLNQFAWDLLTAPGLEHRDFALALTAARRANELRHGEEAYILDTYALALFENGQLREAVETQRKAIALAEGDEALLAELRERLEQFEAALRKAGD